MMAQRLPKILLDGFVHWAALDKSKIKSKTKLNPALYQDAPASLPNPSTCRCGKLQIATVVLSELAGRRSVDRKSEGESKDPACFWQRQSFASSLVALQVSSTEQTRTCPDVCHCNAAYNRG